MHIGRDVLDGRLGIEPSGSVNDPDGAASGPVVACHRANDLARTRDLPRLHERAGRDDSIAEVHRQIRPVGVDRPETLDRNSGFVDIFPATVNYASVAKRIRRKIIEVIGRYLTDICPVRVHPIHHTNRGVPAVGELRQARAQEGDPAVREPAGVVVVPETVGNPFQSGPVSAYGPKMVSLVFSPSPAK